jgi:Tol biopolymer transport system component
MPRRLIRPYRLLLWLGAFLLTMVFVALAGCGSGRSTPIPRPPVAAPPLEHPQVLMTMTQSAGGEPRVSLVVKTLGEPGFKVLVKGSLHRGPGGGSWSPDGRKVAFTESLGEVEKRSGVYERSAVHIVNADGSGSRRLTPGADAGAPVWSPDGQSIIFVRQTQPETGMPSQRLWIMRSDGGERRPLTRVIPRQFELPGAFSPDGSSFVFTRILLPEPGHAPLAGSITWRSYSLRLGSSEETALHIDGRDASFAPNGERLVLVTERDKNGTIIEGEDEEGPASELYTMNLDGSDSKRLTRTRDLVESLPSFSPDAARIVYDREEDRFHHGVFEMNADGICARAIAYSRSEWLDYSSPAWRPGSKPGRISC